MHLSPFGWIIPISGGSTSLEESPGGWSVHARSYPEPQAISRLSQGQPEKRLWKSGCDGAPSAGRRRKCLLDLLSLVLLVQRHRFWTDPLNSHNTPGLGGTTTWQRKVLGRRGKETTVSGLGVKQSCVQTPAPSLCAPGSVRRELSEPQLPQHHVA